MRRCDRARAAWIVLGVVAGCAHAGLEPGHTTWRHVESEHFTVHGAVDDEILTTTAIELERIQAALESAFFPRQTQPHTEVLLFAQSADLRAARAAARRQPPRTAEATHPLALVIEQDGVPRRAPERRFSTFLEQGAARALANRSLARALKAPPAWLRVGFVEYVALVQLEDDRARFGHRDPLLLRELVANRFVPLGDLVTAPPEAWDSGDWVRSHHASAWAFVHFIMNAQAGAFRPRFATLLPALGTDTPEPARSRDALAAAFPDQPLAALSDRVRAYAVDELARRPSVETIEVAIRAPQAPKRAAPDEPDVVAGLLLQL